MTPRLPKEPRRRASKLRHSPSGLVGDPWVYHLGSRRNRGDGLLGRVKALASSSTRLLITSKLWRTRWRIIDLRPSSVELVGSSSSCRFGSRRNRDGGRPNRVGALVELIGDSSARVVVTRRRRRDEHRGHVLALADGSADCQHDALAPEGTAATRVEAASQPWRTRRRLVDLPRWPPKEPRRRASKPRQSSGELIVEHPTRFRTQSSPSATTVHLCAHSNSPASFQPASRPT
jgi:hypothetical protein